MFLSLFSMLIIIVSSLLSVAFYTIMERKTLGYIQTRKGPNKVGFLGILQPFSDALKLFSKSIVITETMNVLFSSISPAMILILSISIWPILPLAKMGLFDSNLSILSFFVISSMMVYALLMIGWSANSKYCHLGSIRGVAQIISYEVSLFLIILTSATLSNSYSFFIFHKHQDFLPFAFILFVPFIMWMITCLAETNRSPFDFAEGESELVSGFNVEYMGGWFALIFLAEYLSMITLCFISVILFFGSLLSTKSISCIIILSLSFLWIRGTLPRYRYDLLMNLNWKIFLPISISFLTIMFPLIIMSS